MAKTHGHSQDGGGSAYSSWQAMKTRCLNSKATEWPNYGGRGIKVCERWLKFENFLADMGPRPPGTELEREDNDGDYEPGNVRWATDREQANNRRSNVKIRGRNISEHARETGLAPTTIGMRRSKGLSEDEVLGPLKRKRRITFRGETLTRTEWARRLGISNITLTKRLKKWPLEKVLTTPPQRNGSSTKGRKVGRTITFNGETLTLREWSERIGLTPQAIRNRINEGWPLSRALKGPKT